MATHRNQKAYRASSSDLLEEIFSRVKELNREGVPPIIDPTANVLSLVGAAMKRQDDLRASDAKFTDEIRKIEQRYEDKLNALQDKLAQAESRRLDAVLAVQKADVALANEKAGTTATTLANQVQGTRESLEKRLSLIEQNQYLGVGASVQRTEGQARGQWTIERIISIAAIVVAILAVWLKVK